MNDQNKPDHLKEFITDQNSTRDEIEQKAPGIVDRATDAQEHKSHLEDDLSPKGAAAFKAQMKARKAERDRSNASDREL